MEAENTTRQSSQTTLWAEQREVYYYSSFDLFDCDSSGQEFYQFTAFIDKVASELGNEWNREAASLYYPHLSSSRIFITMMELWLAQYPSIGLKIAIKRPSFTPRFMQKVQYQIKKEMESKENVTIVDPPNSAFKAVCLGFFVTANECWQELFQTIPELKPQNLSNCVIREVKTTINQTLKPLMVISEKIGSVFGKKKRKLNQEMEPDQRDTYKFSSCYKQFRKTMDIEKELERKMSDLDIDTEEGPSRSGKFIEKKNFRDEESPIGGSILGNVYGYVTGFLQRNSSWQVASSFVTQILEMNQVRLQEGKKVKVMRPAQDFYRKLVLVWLMLQKQSEEGPSFGQFLETLKTFLEQKWQQRYMIPTRFFFERMKEEWALTRIEGPKNEKEVLATFISRVRLGMQSQWEHKIKLDPRDTMSESSR